MKSQLRDCAEEIAFGRMQRTLDELHHAEPHAVAEHAHGHAERGRGLALARARIDDQQTLFDRRGGLLFLVAFLASLGHAQMRFFVRFHDVLSLSVC